MNYQKMKPSGIDWIGAIPQHWNVQKAKYMFVQKSDRGNKKSLTLLSPTQNYGVIPQEMYEQLSGFSTVKLNEKTNFNLLKTVHKGAYVISLRSFQGGFEYSEFEGVVSPAYQVFYPTVPVSDYFYKYLFKTQIFIDKINSYTMSLRDGKPIAYSDFGRTYIPVPPVLEQQLIASHLDNKCSEIDTLVSDIQSQIDTLAELKKSIIAEAVTKGLNSSVETKDSGIDWIGRIPKHWTKQKIKNACSLIGSGTTPSSNVMEYYDGDVNWIQSGDIYQVNEIQSVKTQISYLGLKSAPSLKVYVAPFIVIAMYGGSVGNTAISKIDACVNQACCCLKPNKYNDLDFLYYWIEHCKADFLSIAIGGGQPNISQEKIKNQHYVVPPLNEQKEIAQYLKNKCAEIDTVILEKKQQLETLEEYRKSLIYEYVTGKKQVKENA